MKNMSKIECLFGFHKWAFVQKGIFDSLPIYICKECKQYIMIANDLFYICSRSQHFYYVYCLVNFTFYKIENKLTSNYINFWRMPKGVEQEILQKIPKI